MCIYSSMEFITLYTDCLGAWKWAQGGYDYLMQRGVILHNNSTVKKKKKSIYQLCLLDALLCKSPCWVKVLLAWSEYILLLYIKYFIAYIPNFTN